jgi:hypothetical protein
MENFIWSFAVISMVRASPDFAAAGAAEVAAGEVGDVVAVEAAAVAELDGAVDDGVEDVAEFDEPVSFLPQPTIRSAAQTEMGKNRIFMARTTL